MNFPKAYLITFTTYGTWLHGSPKGSVDRENNIYDMPYLPANPAREKWETNQTDNAIVLNKQERNIVLETIISHCKIADWNLIAAHVRSNHLHTVIGAQCPPDKIMKSLKMWATRKLRKECPYLSNKKIWTRNGSNKYLWDHDSIKKAVNYTLHEQGNLMSVFPKIWNNTR